MIYLFFFSVLLTLGLVIWVIFHDISEEGRGDTLGHSPKSKRRNGSDNC